jgi:hypothetical protein
MQFYPLFLDLQLSSALSFEGHTVAQLVEALRYKSEGHWFDSRRCHWNFSVLLKIQVLYKVMLLSDSK